LSHATLLYNPVAGRRPGRREAEIRAAAQVLSAAGFELNVAASSGPASARQLAKSAARRGDQVVFACGGDGTLNEVINGLALSPCALAILPGGTANIAARDLGLPRDPVVAARTLARAKPHRIALGRVTWHRRDPTPDSPVSSVEPPEPRFFLSVAGVGFDAYVIHRLAWSFKTALGVAAYAWEAIHQVCRYDFPPFTCRNNQGEWRGTQALFQRTGRYAGWFHPIPGGSLLDNRMRVCVFESSSPWRYALYTSALALQRHLALADVRLVEGSHLVCAAEEAFRPVYVELDGELAGELPATFELVPDALTLLLPEDHCRAEAR
jgi:diacylglycerol kinase (ATP)